MDVDDLRYLQSPEGRALLAELATEPLTPDTHLSIAARLRQRTPPERARAALELAMLRLQAGRKFSRAAEMFFTRTGLEQATAEPVAAYRAGRFAAAGQNLVADLGCGIGSDALALAQAGAAVVAIDKDRLRAAIAQANAAALGLTERVLPVVADLTALPPLPVDAFFYDPARRTESGPRAAAARRLRSVEEYQPPLSLIDRWRPVVGGGAIKVSPGIDYRELPPEVETEFISQDGEVKEAVLWHGTLRSEATRRATLLPGGSTLTDRSGPDVGALSPPLGYLYEPDGAVIRAHLVAQLGALLNAAQIDPAIAYLTAGEIQPTLFARAYQINDYFPFQLKRLRAYLRERHVGRVTIKKRGSPLDPDELRQALRLRGDNHAVVFLTQVMGEPMTLIGEDAA